MYSEDLKDAIAECEAYNRMGALNDEVMLDIANDYHIDFDTLYNHYYDLY
jgi:hypothetical protein